MDHASSHAAWLYLGKESRTKQDNDTLIDWCLRHRVGKLLLHLETGSKQDPDADKRIDEVIEACSSAGIEVHGMIGTLQHKATTREQLLVSKKDAYCVDYDGVSNWEEPLLGRSYVLDPSDPEAVSLIADHCRKLLVKHSGLAGIHLDFIRYYHYESRLIIDTRDAGHWTVIPRSGQSITLATANGVSATFFVEQANNRYNDPPVGDRLVLKRSYHYCFCKRCLDRFRLEYDIALPSQFKETRQQAEWIMTHHAAAWYAFRASLITNVVRAIRRTIKSVSESVQLSAAIWYNSPYGNELRSEPFRPNSEYEQFGQEWWEWVKEGLVDFICPMNYWLTPDSFGQVIRDQLAKSDNRVPLYAGLLRSSEFPIDDEKYKQYVSIALDAGATGISFFSYGGWKSLNRDGD
ncbi:family 10 glycosylhydrolase [Paenibacillus sp. J2TS4]|uniref:family 10 glycosylhydrolase n=1 Tax=Paenibacillus sp. J2TS4 TaxID=2807194 RepID=UPI001B2662FF|nr:family 10 glycosylhydrolase [Paenibacillus sp. J2TS4]GIP35248.1 hypothetical protein J2TS4_44580 [Paenibacillus sp. J2TS4]